MTHPKTSIWVGLLGAWSSTCARSTPIKDTASALGCEVLYDLHDGRCWVERLQAPSPLTPTPTTVVIKIWRQVRQRQNAELPWHCLAPGLCCWLQQAMAVAGSGLKTELHVGHWVLSPLPPQAHYPPPPKVNEASASS
jgi:hypothetical protein